MKLSTKHFSLFRLGILILICLLAISVRLFSVLRYESVIHEFDPYFNFRATKYFVSEGVYEFLNWFDDKTWYPLGRIVGGTLYPGLMFTAGSLYHILHFLNITVSIRDLCVLTAPIFSAFTCIATYVLTTDIWDDRAGLVSAALIAVVPGYISRSVAGSYDNEGIAIFALIFTFALWNKALKTGSLKWACLCSLAYFYMVSAWGGYVFIINIIALHALLLIVTGRYSYRLYIAYSTFFVLGTILSMQINFVGFQPIRSSEHLSFLGMFGIIQLYAFIEWARARMSAEQFKTIGQFSALSLFLVGLAALTIGLATGKISPWDGRLYSLLDPTYAKENIPIIASVSEHQPSAWASLYFDLESLLVFFPAGIYFCFKNLTEGTIFLLIYALTSAYFSGVMVRLVLVLSPVMCVLAGIAISNILATFSKLSQPNKKNEKKFEHQKPISLSIIFGLFVVLALFSRHSVWVSSEAYTSPSIVLTATDGDGEMIIFDDFRESYRWLSHNTDPNSKIMSWWDYGYQLSAMANRTVIVDNNTWNNTHIATVAKAFASNEDEAVKVLRSLDVDYVLVLFGGYVGYSGDDINKFIWMIRICSTVYPEVQEDDFLNNGAYLVDENATKTMYESLMFKLNYYHFDKLPRINGYDRLRRAQVGHLDFELKHFEEAFTSPNWLVRIYRLKKPNPRVWSQ